MILMREDSGHEIETVKRANQDSNESILTD
jgi:hypothetical protein